MDMAVKYHRKSLVAFMLLGTLLNLAFVSSAKADEEITVSRSLTVISNDDVVIGNRKAFVIIVEYFSPTCTHCNVFHQEVFPELKAKYIDTGKIAYVMREFVGNKQDLDASLLARCDGSTAKYMQFKDLILSKQEEWAFGNDYRKHLENFALLGGISKEQYGKCLNNDALAQTLIENTQIAANLHNFIGTPSFFINGKLLDIEQCTTAVSISQEIDKILN
jgi:protein-disulfide isomerase